MNRQIIINANLLLVDGTLQKNAYLEIADGKIQTFAAMSELDEATKACEEIIDANNKLVTPALIDCHSHVVYAGDRAEEYQRRLEGVSYSQIAKEGGGIQSTVRDTRKASFDELYEQSYARVKRMKEQGVATLEIKSGYGLDLETEIKILKVAKQLGRDLHLRVQSTFLGAHALPLDYKGRADKYIDEVIEMLPEIKAQSLADSVDVFCENIGFNLSQTERVFQAANELGFNLKCHAEQLSDLGASGLAARFGAQSCDHLEYTSTKSIHEMAKSGTVAVLLPGAYYFLREEQKPPIAEFRRQQIEMALATDSNPGSSPTESLPLMMNMASVLFSMTVKEVWLAVTKHASKALGLQQQIGSIEPGKRAELIIWDCDNLAAMCYGFGQTRPLKRLGC